MKRIFRTLLITSSLFIASANAIASPRCAPSPSQPRLDGVRGMLNRLCGQGAADRFSLRLDTALAEKGAETFIISSCGDLPAVEASSLSALTTGINWYLNHEAGINLTWNNPSTDISAVTLPLPAGEDKHTSSAIYRYYLNYCTFSYSMSTWPFDRWEQEIDWMAQHGINMPLQIVGLEEVWRKMLMEDYGYTQEEVDEFVAGPAFMAWFGMNNLEGWGGNNPEWWYERQAALGRKINDRMRELGIEPVLPGFSGMVPSNFTEKTGIPASDQGRWCGFVRPRILDATSPEFADVAANYYKRLKEVMGESQYYSIDPFHEGGAAPDNVDLAYCNLYQAMDEAVPGSKFVIQSWQWSPAQKKSLDNIPLGKLVVLDLFADARPNLGGYKGHDTVYSTIFNFGGRTGFFGRFNKIIDGYFDGKAQHPSVKGIGAAPEAIEQTPVLYDLLFELPWLAEKPDPKQWMAEYVARRYGTESPEATEAWELLRNSALDCHTPLQGPHEAIVCARPELNVERVSSWGGTDIFYNPETLAEAAYKLLDANLDGDNYSYDLADITRQALTDHSKLLLSQIREAAEKGDGETFASLRDSFLQLILDIDELLNSNDNFMLGRWTEGARRMADEAPGTTDADRDWLELDNARTLITTWGPEGPAAGLRDYSYREWGGMLKDFYYPRWKRWFDNGMQQPEEGWFPMEWAWAHDNSKRYATAPQGDTREIAGRLLRKHLPR